MGHFLWSNICDARVTISTTFRVTQRDESVGCNVRGASTFCTLPYCDGGGIRRCSICSHSPDDIGASNLCLSVLLLEYTLLLVTMKNDRGVGCIDELLLVPVTSENQYMCRRSNSGWNGASVGGAEVGPGGEVFSSSRTGMGVLEMPALQGAETPAITEIPVRCSLPV